jgi:hypothetical protein
MGKHISLPGTPKNGETPAPIAHIGPLDLDATMREELDKARGLIVSLDTMIADPEVDVSPALVRERNSTLRAVTGIITELRQLEKHAKNKARDLSPDQLAESAIEIVRDLPLELRRKVAAEVAGLASEGVLSK